MSMGNEKFRILIAANLNVPCDITRMLEKLEKESYYDKF